MGKKVTKRWARFWSPGSFMGESWDVEIDHLDPTKIEWPDRAYAFSLHTRDDIVEDGETFKGKSKQHGKLYYHPDSKIETMEEARSNPDATEILLQNMESNKWPEIIWARWGGWPQPFDPDKMVVL